MVFVQSLVKQISNLQKQEISNQITQRMQDFSNMHSQGNKEWFCELCFCLLTANTSAVMGLKMQENLGYDGFYSLPQKKLTNRLQELGYRFYNRRSEFITLAREYADIKDKIKKFDTEFEARDWLKENIKGLGLKESSHFLRNVGYKNLAILDKHVLNLLHEHSIFEKPKNLNQKNYLLAEKKLEQLCTKTNLTQAELDLYLWYVKTGKVLK